MCHQSVGLVHGTLEKAGIPCISTTVVPFITRYSLVSRSVYIRFPGFSRRGTWPAGTAKYSICFQASAAIGAVNGDYERHSCAAFTIAYDYFKAETVLGKILDQLGL
jgi:hypothetical protein